MGKYLCVQAATTTSTLPSVIRAIFHAPYFRPIGFAGLEGPARHDRWILAGYAVEPFVERHTRGRRRPASVEIEDALAPDSAAYLHTIERAIAKWNFRGAALSPFERMDSQLKLTFVPDHRLPDRAGDRLAAWALESGIKSFAILGVVDLDHDSNPGQPWFSSYRTLVAGIEGALEPGGPILELRATIDQTVADGWRVSLCSSSTVWVDPPVPPNADVRANPDECLLRFGAVWEALANHVISAELVVEGKTFQQQITRIRGALTGIG